MVGQTPLVSVSPSSFSILSKARFSVVGMTCASCVNTVEDCVKNLNGVNSISVSLLMETADVTFNANLISIQQIEEAMNDIGYSVTVKSSTVVNSSAPPNAGSAPISSTAIVGIKGMTCASCVASIERAVNNLPAVRKCTVNLLTESAAITFAATPTCDPPAGSAISLSSLPVESLSFEQLVDQVIDCITSIGYEASILPLSEDGRDSRLNASRAQELIESRQNQILFYRRLLIFSLTFAIPVFCFSMILPNISSTDSRLQQPVYGQVSMNALILWTLSSPVVFGSGAVFYKAAFSALRHRSSNMAVLISIGTWSAYIYAFIGVARQFAASPVSDVQMNMGMNSGSTAQGEDSAVASGAEMFFETASTLITLVVLGRYLETVAKGKTSEALTKLMALQSETAIQIQLDSHQLILSEQEIPTSKLTTGMVVKVVRGSKFPADGEIIVGSCSVDESLITGEFMPVTKTVGDQVIGSSINLEGLVYVRVTACGENSTLSNILRLMEDAQSSKARIQAFADKISSFFVPGVLILALVDWVIWFAVVSTSSAPLSWYQEEGQFLFSFLFAISVLVIACPCALGLATPTAVMVGTGVGARMGILIKGGAALETAHRVSAIIFDKTGTLTYGKPTVSSCYLLNDHHKLDEICYFVGSVESNSEHVLATAIVEYAKHHSSRSFTTPSSFDAVTGFGVSAVVDERRILIGNRMWLKQNNVEMTEAAELAMSAYEIKGQTALLVSIDQFIACVLVLSDVPKSEAKCVIQHLNKMKIAVYMCTGDNRRTATYVANQLGLSLENVVAEAVPSDKYDLVQRLRAQGKVVAMAGDGINDIVALTAADLGVSVGSATDIAMEAADVVLMKNDLRDVITAIDLSRRTFNRIRLNFVWALGYNLLGIPIAAGCFYPVVRVRLPPEVAALAMALSSVSVICSSLLLRFYRRPVVKSSRTINNARETTNDQALALIDSAAIAAAVSSSAIDKELVPLVPVLSGAGDRTAATTSTEPTITVVVEEHESCCPCDSCICSSVPSVSEAHDDLGDSVEQWQSAIRVAIPKTACCSESRGTIPKEVGESTRSIVKGNCSCGTCKCGTKIKAH